MSETLVDTTFSVTERAFARVAKILSKETASALRVSVEGGGCSGFQYRYDLVDGPEAVDPVSLPFLEGAQLDFIDDLMGQSFQITNPNAQSSCGCGTSFSLL